MSIREKFEAKCSINTIKEAKVFSRDCEKVADEFAIKFAKWILLERSGFNRQTETKELLEIYKKEKRL